MKRVLIIANDDAGLYNFRKEVVERIAKEYEVHICLPQGGFIDYFVNLGCVYHPVVFNLHGINPFADLKLLNTYIKLIKYVKPFVVLTYTIKPNVYGGMACQICKIPYIVNITGLGSAIENSGFLQKIAFILYKTGIRKAEKVFFQNAYNQEFMLSRGAIKGEYDLLPGSGVNLERYYFQEYPANETVDFVFISRIMREKGIDIFLDAAEYIRDKYPYTRFHVCGTCEEAYEEKLENLQKKGVISYHGRVNGLQRIHEFNCCTIHPSYYPEGMSNVLLESCASGRPIITTKRPGCGEIVDDGINGFVIKERDSSDLIRVIEKFLMLSLNERKEMGIASRKKVEREFDRNIVVGKYMEAISKCVD